MAGIVWFDMELTGAQIIVKKLVEHGVKIVFEYPGGTICSILDELSRQDLINTFICRHEQAVIHAADAYARLTQKPSVCMVTSGPGASNLVTGIANAFMDSVPIVIISGQVAEWDLKGDTPVRQRGFQELDIVSVVRSITKEAFLVKKVCDIADTIDRAFFIAATSRPGPVLVDIPINLQYTSCDFPRRKCGKKIKIHGAGHRDIAGVVKKLIASKKPLVIAGGGIILSKACKKLMALLQKYRLPAAQTLMGVTSVSCDYELNLGFVGYAGSRLSSRALKEADFVLAVGLRFDNRAFPAANKEFGDSAYIVHVDCDKNEFNHRVAVNKTVFSDAKIFLTRLMEGLEKSRCEQKNEWVSCINSWRKELSISCQKDKPELTPKFILTRLSELTKNKSVIITTDVGQHQLWTAQYFRFRRANSLVTSGGMGTMGFGLPAAIGAQLACSNVSVFNITSDGSFQMNIQELATVKEKELPIKIVLFNNRCLGMVRQIQEFAFNARYESTIVNEGVDFVSIARAYGIKAFCVGIAQEVETALERLVNSKTSMLVDFRINRFQNVYPIRVKGEIIDKDGQH